MVGLLMIMNKINNLLNLTLWQIRTKFNSFKILLFIHFNFNYSFIKNNIYGLKK